MLSETPTSECHGTSRTACRPEGRYWTVSSVRITAAADYLHTRLTHLRSNVTASVMPPYTRRHCF